MQQFGRLISLMNGAGVVWIFALMFLICADIFGRTVFDTPIRGVAEMVSLSLVASVFLQLAYAIHQQRLTRAEFLFNKIQSGDAKLASDLSGLLTLFAFAMCLVIAVGIYPDFIRAFRTAEFAGVQGMFAVQVWPIKFLILVGSVVAAFECGRRAISCFTADGHSTSRGLALILPALILIVTVLLWTSNAEPRLVGAAMIVMVLALITLGMPIAIALLMTGFLGLVVLKQDVTIATKTVALAADGTISEYVFASVPLFVLMGLFVNISDIGRDAFRAAQLIFGRIRGGLGVATVAANAMFAAITGISIASAAIFSKIAVPEMVRQGYTPKFAVGLTAGSSVLGMLIPPSILLIIYGVIAEVSIGGLFRAAVVPGIILAAAFAFGVIGMTIFAPNFVGHVNEKAPEAGLPSSASPEAGLPVTSNGRILLGLIPVAILIVLVLGGIYGGIFAPHEAGAAGAFAAMVLALIKRRLDWSKLWDVIRESGQVTVTILFLIIAASTFSRMLTLTELPQDIAVFLGGTGLGMFGFLFIYLLLLIVLGTVLDSTSILLILLPLALPVVSALGGDLVWFGVVTVIGVEIGLLTPPLGLSVYVIKSSLDDDTISLGTIFAGAFPFVLITCAVTILLMAFPQLSLWL
jgi:tripartite ATP-independent transporter DctM subunit